MDRPAVLLPNHHETTGPPAICVHGTAEGRGMNWSDCVSDCYVYRVGARRLAAFVEVLVPLIVLLIFFVTQSCKNHHVESAQKESKKKRFQN